MRVSVSVSVRVRESVSESEREQARPTLLRFRDWVSEEQWETETEMRSGVRRYTMRGMRRAEDLTLPLPAQDSALHVGPYMRPAVSGCTRIAFQQLNPDKGGPNCLRVQKRSDADQEKTLGTVWYRLPPAW